MLLLKRHVIQWLAGKTYSRMSLGNLIIEEKTIC